MIAFISISSNALSIILKLSTSFKSHFLAVSLVIKSFSCSSQSVTAARTTLLSKLALLNSRC